MRRDKAIALGLHCKEFLAFGEHEAALGVLAPILGAKVPFSSLDLIGETLGQAGADHLQSLLLFLDRLVKTEAMGAYVIAGRGLVGMNEVDMASSFARAREYVVWGDVWYVADIIGERPLGHGLLSHFEGGLSLLERFVQDQNPWVRRSVGVAVHFFNKRRRDAPLRIQRLLELLACRFEERDTSALKGIGWGLKTIGRYYPDLLVPYLRQQMAHKSPRRLLLRKATTYLDPEVRDEILSV